MDDQPCYRRSLDSGPCKTCQICTSVEDPPAEWKDTGANVYSVIPLDSAHLSQQKMIKYYVPYIKRLEAVKPRTYLVNHTNDRDILKWIQEAIPAVEDRQLHFPDCKDPECLFRSFLPSENIPYQGWNAFHDLRDKTGNPWITYGRYDRLWSIAIRRGVTYPEHESYDNIFWHNIHNDVPLDY